MENVLEIRNLSKAYPGFALKGVDLCIPRGYIMGLIGPNGAGKTTLIKLVLNLVRKDAGEVRVFGLDHLEHEVAVKRRLGFVHDAPAFYDYLPLRRIAALIARFYPDWDQGAFLRTAGEFALPLEKRYKVLSRGTKMKFALALALSHGAELILMDEPTSGLDPVFRRELLEHLSGLLQDERRSILFSTHITSDLERIADFVTFLHEGGVVFSAAKDDILDRWGVVKGGPDLPETAPAGLLKGVRRSAFGVEALTDDAPAARRGLPAGTVVEKASLEDIMFHLVKGGSHARSDL